MTEFKIRVIYVSALLTICIFGIFILVILKQGVEALALAILANALVRLLNVKPGDWRIAQED